MVVVVGSLIVITVSHPTSSCIVVELWLWLGLGFDNTFKELFETSDIIYTIDLKIEKNVYGLMICHFGALSITVRYI